MLPVALSDAIAVGEVPTREDLAILAKAGFRSVLNTQPEGEVARHLTSSECGAEAEALGLVYRHQPIATRRPPEAEIRAFASAVAELPKPIYACCYSGSRTTAVWALAAAETMDADWIIGSCAAAGYDIAFMRETLLARRKSTAETRASAASVVLPEAPAKPVAPSEILAAGANGAAVETAATVHSVAAPAAQQPAMPQLVPATVFPRAASAGGFAVSG